MFAGIINQPHRNDPLREKAPQSTFSSACALESSKGTRRMATHPHKPGPQLHLSSPHSSEAQLRQRSRPTRPPFPGSFQPPPRLRQPLEGRQDLGIKSNVTLSALKTNLNLIHAVAGSDPGWMMRMRTTREPQSLGISYVVYSALCTAHSIFVFEFGVVSGCDLHVETRCRLALGPPRRLFRPRVKAGARRLRKP
jgi:hypothetical protein